MKDCARLNHTRNGNIGLELKVKPIIKLTKLLKKRKGRILKKSVIYKPSRQINGRQDDETGVGK